MTDTTVVSDLIATRQAAGEKENKEIIDVAFRRNTTDTLAELAKDRIWIDSAKNFYISQHGMPFEGSDEDVVRYGLDAMTELHNEFNDPTTPLDDETQSIIASKIRGLGDLNDDEKASLFYLMQTYQDKDPVITAAEKMFGQSVSNSNFRDVGRYSGKQDLLGHITDYMAAVVGEVYDFGKLVATPAGWAWDVAKAIPPGVLQGAQGLLDIGYEIDEALFGYHTPNKIDLSSLPFYKDSDSLLGSLAQGLTQFMTVFAGSGGLGGSTVRMLGAGALADASFDPEHGSLSTFLREIATDESYGNFHTVFKWLNVDNAVTEFFDSKVDEDADAVERLKARLVQAGEGSLITAFGPFISQLRRMRNEGAGPVMKEYLNEIETRVDKFIPPPGQLNMGVGPVNKTLWNDVDNVDITNEAKRVQNNYLRKDGWARIEPVKGGLDKDGKAFVEFKEIPYQFHIPPGNMKSATWQAKLVDRMVRDVEDVITRAQGGDSTAREIIAQARWYRAMRTRLREEFGGMGDLFADVLGATSAQTNVTQNWDNTIQILRRFSRGDYDLEIDSYLARLESGEGVNPNKLIALHKSGDFPLITKITGELFNTNSPAATGALVNIFRDIRAGRAPKTPNFTGNLIGYSSNATIDVWAARYLRSIANKPYIPPVAEKTVGGKHLVGSTIDDPKIGAEFGFGQRVFADAATEINTSGVVKQFDQTLGDLGADDLQAVVWFLEKDKWTKKGWTSKAGEGGSLDMEASFAGSSSPDRIQELRAKLGDDTLSTAERASLKAELDSLAADPQRTVVGLSAERPDNVPSNYAQAEMAAELDAVVRNDDAVIGYKLTNTYGRFMGTDERALDAEFVVRENFDATELTNSVIRAGKDRDQDAVFVSHVVDDTHPNARPGLEIYFTHAGGPDRAAALSDRLSEYGIDGFTYVTDARHADRANVQMGSGQPDVASITGLRLQYIPEFEHANWATMSDAEKSVARAEKEDIFDQILSDLANEGEISQANLIYYDTDVIQKGDYDVRLKGPTSPNRTKVRGGQQDSADGSRSNRSQGNQRTGTVSDGQRPQGNY